MQLPNTIWLEPTSLTMWENKVQIVLKKQKRLQEDPQTDWYGGIRKELLFDYNWGMTWDWNRRKRKENYVWDLRNWQRYVIKDNMC